MKQKIRCFFGRHAEVCVQEIVLTEAIIEHLHVCYYCTWRKKLPERELPEEMKKTLSQFMVLGQKKPEKPAPPPNGWVN